jgi:hypothetical protein
MSATGALGCSLAENRPQDGGLPLSSGEDI